jgi:ribonuclease D
MERITNWLEIPLSDRMRRRLDEVAARENVAPEALASVLLDTALKAAAPPENTAEWRAWRQDARRTFRQAIRAVYLEAKDLFVRDPARRRPSGA